MTWSNVTGTPRKLVDGYRLRCQPRCLLDGLVAEDQRGQGGDGDREADGRHHLDQGQRPVEDGGRGRRTAARRAAARRCTMETTAAAHDRPTLLGVKVVVEAGDEEGQRPEGEVEDARRRVGDDQASGRDRVDATQHQSGDHELKHPAVPLCAARVPPGTSRGFSCYQPFRRADQSARPSTSHVSVLALAEHRIPEKGRLLAGPRSIRFRLAPPIV